MQNIISLDTKQPARRGFQHEGPPPPNTHTGETLGGGWVPRPPPVPTPMNFSKHLLTDWLGVSTVELCGWKKRDLGGILRYVRAQKWGGDGDLLLPPPSLESGGTSAPLAPSPLFLRLWIVVLLYAYHSKVSTMLHTNLCLSELGCWVSSLKLPFSPVCSPPWLLLSSLKRMKASLNTAVRCQSTYQ